MNLIQRAQAGDRLSLARLLSHIENEEEVGLAAQAALFRHTGRAHLIGITGAPGTGKSTLVNQLTLHVRHAAKDPQAASSNAVAIVAVDPSSPFTGGAILGDRIRMRDLAGDEGVFIRSMASRGSLGGLSRTTPAVVDALDAAGFAMVLIETVGAGQAEVDIARTAHTTIVVTAPGLGDEVQAIKAGILEIADILVVNKSDLPGAEQTISALRASLEMGLASRSHRAGDPPEESGAKVEPWLPPVFATVATRGEGVDRVLEAVHRHRAYLQRSGELRRRERERVRGVMQALLRDLLAAQFLQTRADSRFEAAVDRVLERTISPREAIRALLEEGRP